MTIAEVYLKGVEYLEKRLRHLLKSEYIRSFDEKIPFTNKYKKNIEDADMVIQKSNSIKLPCDVGDTAYTISPTGEIIEAKIERLVISKDDETKILGVVLHDGSQNYGDYCKYAGAASEFKTVFLTKDEAETKLKEREK